MEFVVAFSQTHRSKLMHVSESVVALDKEASGRSERAWLTVLRYGTGFARPRAVAFYLA